MRTIAAAKVGWHSIDLHAERAYRTRGLLLDSQRLCILERAPAAGMTRQMKERTPPAVGRSRCRDRLSVHEYGLNYITFKFRSRTLSLQLMSCMERHCMSIPRAAGHAATMHDGC